MNKLSQILIMTCFLGLLFVFGCSDDGSDSPSSDTGADTDTDTDTDSDTDADPHSDTDTNTTQINGKLETIDGIDVLWVWGTREEMGYAEGSLLCGRISEFSRDYILNYIVPISGYDYKTLKGLISVAYKISQDDEAQLRGMMQGMLDNCAPEDVIVESEFLEPETGGSRQMTYQDFVIAHAVADWTGCSSLSVWGDANKGNGTLHARNLDFLLDPDGAILDGHLLKVYSSADEGDAKWVSVSLPGLIGCISCFTEEGAGITMHNVSGLEPAVMTGNVPRMLAAREAIAATVGAADKVAVAEDVLESLPQQVGNNLHLSLPCSDSDCIGGVIFEYDGASSHKDKRVTVRRPGDVNDGLENVDAIVCTNHYVKRQDQTGSSGTQVRYDTLVNGINDAIPKGGIDLDAALALMATTSEQNTGVPTIHTVIMDTANMTLNIYVGDHDDNEAPVTDPHVMDLNSIFAGFPR